MYSESWQPVNNDCTILYNEISMAFGQPPVVIAPKIPAGPPVVRCFLRGGLIAGAPIMSSPRMLLGLIGANIMGSLSPALFADAFAAAGIDGFYHLIDVDRLPERRLPQLLDAIRVAGFAGANITFPFKQEILPLLDAVDPEAAQTGAINTVAIAPNGNMTGYNFDRSGWRHSFVEVLGRRSAEGASVVLIGAGGAGHAVAFALMDLGVARLVLHDREAARAHGLCANLAKHYGASRCCVSHDLEHDIAKANGVVNATQTGMRGFPGSPVPISTIGAAHWCADVIYTPVETEFLQAAAARGARVLGGGKMCVHTAVGAFRLFTGVDPDVARLHQAFTRALAAREGSVQS
jgi:shikimate dehydrogenase